MRGDVVGLLHDREEGALRAAPGLEQRREVASLAELRGSMGGQPASLRNLWG